MCTRAALCLALLTFAVRGQSLKDFTTPRPLPRGHVIIVGFLGGWERWDDEHRGVRQLALRLRQSGMQNIHVETAGNHRRSAVFKMIRRALDTDQNGTLDPDERSAARVILYGQSFGGAAVVKLARQLDRLGVPVELTVQVDSVGRDDHLIPANVRSAANLYQEDLLTIRGEKHIRALDPARTTILENSRFVYWIPGTGGEPESWVRRTLGGAHARMEADPTVWAHVETLIRHAIAARPLPHSAGLQ